MDREVRLPLQVGTSALWSAARSAATALPALGLIACGVYAVIEFGLDEAGIAVLGFFLVSGGGLGYFAVRHFILALRLRPSDVVLTTDGIRIVGGRERNENIKWSEIASEQCRVTEGDEPRVTLWFLFLASLSVALSLATQTGIDLTPARKVRIYKLWLARRIEGLPAPAPGKLSRRQRRALQKGKAITENIPNSNDVLIAETERPSEERSFQALVESIQSACERDDEDASGASGPNDKPAPTGILHCTQCGALLRPTEETFATCIHCGAKVRVPEKVQAQIRAARTKAEGDASIERSIRRLLDQPGATHVNVMMAIAALPMFVAWPAALYVAIRQVLADAIGFGVTLPLVIFPLATIYGCFLLVRVRLANRAALRVLTLDFGACAPDRKGGPHTCRQCGAPLRDSPGEVVERCAYCSAENLLGVDLRRAAARSKTAAASLQDALKARAKERWRFAFMFVTAITLLVVGALLLRRGLNIPPSRAAQCEKGDASACMALGDKAFKDAKAAHKKFDKPAKYYERACSLGEARGCFLRGRMDETGSPPFKENASGAVVWYEHACAKGSVEGCSSLGYVLMRLQKSDASTDAYAHGCDLNDAHCCFDAATGYVRAHNDLQARAHYKRACTLGWKEACYRTVP